MYFIQWDVISDELERLLVLSCKGAEWSFWLWQITADPKRGFKWEREMGKHKIMKCKVSKSNPYNKLFYTIN